MKINDLHSPVDAFFRQQEPNIPVVYDPEQWNRLAAALDEAGFRDPAQPPAAPPSAVKQPRWRGGKGWWVSGIWMLVLVSSAWIWRQATGKDSGQHQPEAPSFVAPNIAPASDPADHQLDPRHPELNSRVPLRSNQPDVSEKTITAHPSEGVAVADTVRLAGNATLDTASMEKWKAMPDSTVSKVKPAKKKKHLFW